MEAGLYQQDEVPQTPVTPVTADALIDSRQHFLTHLADQCLNG
jgi:hypothetical protein